jgi:hypothetical protein
LVFLDGKLFKKEKDDRTPDGAGPEVKTPEISADMGLNRFSWDMNHAAPKLIPGAKVDLGDPSTGPMVIPGKYTAILTIDGTKLSQTFEIWPDPRLTGKPQPLLASQMNGEADPKLLAEWKEQEKFALQLRDDISRLSVMVERLRVADRQLKMQRDLQKDQPAAAEWTKLAESLATKIDNLEQKLHNPKAVVTYDILAQKGGAKLYSQLVYVYEMARDGDGSPTQGMREVASELQKELNQLSSEHDNLLGAELARLNELASKLLVPKIWVPK